MKTLELIIPVFNEQDNILTFYNTCKSLLNDYDDISFSFLFIDDGSTDATRSIIKELVYSFSDVKLISLSRNFGKESALTAGIDFSSSDAIIPIDVDLQDPPSVIPKLIDKWLDGYPVVLAKRNTRSADSLSKRLSAKFFYWFFNVIADIPMVSDVGDFRLLDRSVVDEIKKLPENRRFMKGLFAWVGFDFVVIKYDRDVRHLGNSKFNGFKLINFAIEGIINYSIKPLRYLSMLGLFSFLVSLCYLLFLIFNYFVNSVTLQGYTSLITSVVFFGSANLLAIGILGEYVGRSYMESKRRPPYIIQSVETHNGP